MAKNFLGQVRRTQVLDYGPGAIIDFRAGARGGGPVSIISTGLEHWDVTAKPPFPGNEQVISEPRLERQLQVRGFRLPPVDDREREKDPKKSWLVGARFPSFLQCPSCNEIKLAKRWDKEPGDPSRWCQRCSNSEKRIHVVPTRFVTACEKGHVDEFPWQWWLSRARRKGQDCQHIGRIKLENRGSIGLAGLFLICMECGASISMDGIFGKDALRGLGCKGRRPWQGDSTISCDATPRVLQRGASNLYFPLKASALSIPPWSDKLQQLINVRWSELIGASRQDRKALLRVFESKFQNLFNMTLDEVLDEIEKRIDFLDSGAQENLKDDEYRNLCEGIAGARSAELGHPEFEVRQQIVPKGLTGCISKLGKVVRLREVRALKAFSRIYEPNSLTDPGRATLCELSDAPLDWLPAVEVRGEGVFVALDSKSLEEWEKYPSVVDRIGRLNQLSSGASDTAGDGETVATPRLMLLHSLAHALMRYMSLECGYETASIRERVYVSDGPMNMAGILIYTSSSDSEGTLGGLARQAEPDLFEPLLLGALESIGWCSSDPLCINGITSASETYNLAACHSCMLVPETSCELFNRFLDRTLLVGSYADDVPGYFQSLLPHDDD